MIDRLYKRAFTLIELLVVIAIIGILASVVLASLNSARDKGTDAANKSNLNNIRAQTELFYSNGESYEGVCASSVVSRAISAADAECDDSASAWAAAVDMLTADVSYCVDSTGNTRESVVDAETEVSDRVCNGTGSGGGEEEEGGGGPPMASPTVRYLDEPMWSLAMFVHTT